METRAALYAAQVQQLINGAKSLTPEAEQAIAELLAKTSSEIVQRLPQLDAKSFTANQLQTLRVTIDAQLARFRDAAASKIAELQEKAARMATVSTSSTVAAMLGTAVSHGTVNMQTVRVAQGYSADLITGLSADAAAKIKATIQRAVMGGQSLGAIVDQVGQALPNGNASGVFIGIGDRARKVSMNEVLRLHSISSQARLYDLAKVNSDIQKMWMHLPAARVPRLTHLLADGQTVDVDEPFLVGGEELMFPRDPSGTPENTIFCHCVSVPKPRAGTLHAAAKDKATLARFGIKIGT